MTRVLLVCVALVGAAGVLPGTAAAEGVPVASCNGGACSGDWYKTNVTVGWSYDAAGASASGCGSATVTVDTSSTSFACTVSYPATGRTYGQSITIKKDSSPPTIKMSLSRDPDNGGWYTQRVSVSVSGDDGASGLASCSGGGTYGGPDGGAIALNGTCTDNAGNAGSASVTIKYDTAAPTVTATPSRKPDANGWYNHPVGVAFNGTDGGSGVRECTPAAVYKGPDASPAKLVGQCRDVAGHLSAPVTVELRYDATPPARPTLGWVKRGTSISLRWTAGKDVVRAKLTRAPGLKGKRSAVVYQGKAKRFVDRSIAPGTRYWYQVTLFDQAGNRSTRSLGPRPPSSSGPASKGKANHGPAGIVSPADGAVLTRPPLVAWSEVTKARFYNVQLWRGQLKVLTTWVRRPKLALKPSWTSQGRRHSLVAGKYRLYVWPAFGTPKNPRYGTLVGQSAFVVKRR